MEKRVQAVGLKPTATRETLGSRLANLRGIGPGFDHLRIGLALAIFLWHSCSLTYGEPFVATLPLGLLAAVGALLPMFFGLSGFLVMGSALRTGELKTFITFRVLRILPALATEITLSALVLGPILTSLPLSDYFTSPLLPAYFGSLVGRVRFVLPGMFLANPWPGVVNMALWTVGPEILCYVAMALMMLTGAYRRSRAVAGIAAAFLLVAFAAGWLFPERSGAEVLPPRLLIWGFLAGNLLYLFRERIVFSGMLALLAAFLGAGLIGLNQVAGGQWAAVLAVPLLVYVVAVIGLMRLPPLPLLNRGDYSYGVYIFGFPIQQAVIALLPGLRSFWWVTLVALPLTFLFAIASWHLIEKPALGLRRRVARHEGAPLPAGRSSARAWLLGAALAAYGLFVIDAAAVLPLRAGSKLVLAELGLRAYKPADERLFVPR